MSTTEPNRLRRECEVLRLLAGQLEPQIRVLASFLCDCAPEGRSIVWESSLDVVIGCETCGRRILFYQRPSSQWYEIITSHRSGEHAPALHRVDGPAAVSCSPDGALDQHVWALYGHTLSEQDHASVAGDPVRLELFGALHGTWGDEVDELIRTIELLAPGRNSSDASGSATP